MKHLIWILIVISVISSCADHSGYIINGVVEGADGQKAILQMVEEFEMVVKDSTTIRNGKFRFKGKVETPEFCVLEVGGNGPVQFFIENATINIAVKIDQIADSKVTGSKEQDIYSKFNASMKGFENQVKPLNDAYMSLRLSGEEDEEKEKELLSEMDKIRESRTAFMVSFVQKYPNTVVAAFIVDNMLSQYITLEQLQSIADTFDSSLDKSQWVQFLRESLEIAKRTNIGQPFLDITLKDPDDQTISLSDYAGKGKYLLIDFWASWCRPCRIANPQLVKLYEKYNEKGFEIVGISLDREKAKWLQAIEDDHMSWKHMSDLKFWQTEAVKLYSVSTIPYAILLDKEGLIIAKDLDVNELEVKLEEIFD